MSIISNFKFLEDEINKLRIQKGLRILWSDFEIYDLLAENMTEPQILALALFPPCIVQVNSGQPISNFAQLLNDYTHIAVKTHLGIGQKLQIHSFYSIFLTKRNIAVDSISLKYVRGKYCLTMHIAQLNRQFSFWGVQALAESLRTVGPKYVVKRKTMWILEYEFEQSIRSLFLYSTRRQPSYGKNQNYFDLPRDAHKQTFLKFRTYASVMDNYLKSEGKEKLISFTGFSPQINAKNLTISQNKNDKKSQQASEGQIINELMQLKCKISDANKIQKTILYKFIKIKQVYSSLPQTELAQHDIFKELQVGLRNLAQYNSSLKQNSNYDFNNTIKQHQNTLVSFEVSDQVTILQKLQVLQELRKNNQASQNQDMLNQLILGFGNLSLSKKLCQIKINVWLRIYHLNASQKEANNHQVRSQIMLKILIIESGKLLKDSQDAIQQLERFLGTGLRQCLIKSIEKHEQNQLFTSDLLFILMNYQKLQNLVQLYSRYPIIHTSLYVAISLSQYIVLMGMPCNDNIDLIYEIKCEIPKIERIQFEQDQCQNQKTALSLINFKRYSVFIQKFSDMALFASRIFTVSSKKFKLFMFKENKHIFCFIELLRFKTLAKNKNMVFCTFNVMIQLIFNQKKRSKLLGWNFSIPSHCVGCSFQIGQEQICSLECSIYMKPQVVHQSIMNYVAIRYVQLFKFSCETAEIQSRENFQNQRLSKRRSTFQLENLSNETNLDVLPISCFLHKTCEKCQNLLEVETLYNIHQIDMYSVLLSTPFKIEMHSLLCFFKYVLVNNEKQINIEFLLSYLRADYLFIYQLLGVFNRHSIDKQVSQRLRALLEYKLKLPINRESQETQSKNYLFRGKGRSLQQIGKFQQKDYSKQFLEFLKNQN